MPTDKQFLLWSLPVALVIFVAGPVAVLHSFDLIGVPDSILTKSYDHTGNTQLSMNKSAAQLPSVIPLLFEMAKYPAIGHQTLEVHDLRLMNLTSFAELVGKSSRGEKSEAVLGYMSTTEVLRLKKQSPGSYPVGDLLLITEISFTGFDDEAGKRESIVLETQRIRRFRLKNVQYNEASGLLFGHVDWINEQTV